MTSRANSRTDVAAASAHMVPKIISGTQRNSSGFTRELLKKVKHRRGRASDAMTDRGELVKTPWVASASGKAAPVL
jgi:hypothetical protein